MDPGVIAAAFQQLQQVKGYYKFSDVLSFDRYKVSGSAVPQDMLVGVRDMSGPPAGQDNWVNTHLVYTHGFGFVRRVGERPGGSGNPLFTESDIPPSGELGVRQPRVYFGEQETSYAIVGGHQQELDYPNQSAGGQANTTLPRQRRRPGRLAAEPAPVRDQVPGAQHPAVRRASTATRRSCTSGTRCRGWPRSRRS